eukprot:403355136
MQNLNGLQNQASSQSLAKLSFLDLSQTMVNQNFSQQNNRTNASAHKFGTPQRFDESPEPKQKQVDELIDLINQKSIFMAKKRTLGDLTLMELLNGFDVVVAEKKPRTDIANHVYRQILRQEREKQYSSIQDLTSEIKALKLSMIEKQQVKHNFRQNESVEMRTSTHNMFMNRDLEMVSSLRSPSKNAFHRDQNQSKLQLPKLNLTGIIRQSPQGHSKRSQSMNQYYLQNSYNKNERAIDSDRAIAFAYYTRKLLLNGWRAFYNYHLEKSNSRVLDQISHQRFAKYTKKRVFRALYQQAKQHYGHGSQNKRALAFFQLRTAVRYLQKWKKETHDNVLERQQLEIVQEHLTLIKKRQVFKQLKNVALKLQMNSVQNKTSLHIYRQRYLRKALIGLRYFVAFRQNLRQQLRDSKQNNILRLKRFGLRVLTGNLLENQKSRNLLRIAKGVVEFNRLKLAIKQMKEFILQKQQYIKLNQCAENYFKLGLMKTALELLKKNSLLMQGVNKQKYYIDTYYQKKLKFNLFQYILASNMIFIEEESNIMVLKKRQRLRKLFNVLVNNYRENRIQRAPKQSTFYYACYMLLDNSFSKFVDKSQVSSSDKLSFNQFMRRSKVPYYQNLNKQAQQKLKNFYLQKIVQAWKGDTKKLKQFINNRQNLIKFKLLRSWRIKSRKSAKYSYLLNNYLKKQQNQSLSKSFQKLQKYQRSKQFERLIVQKLNQVRQDKKLEKVFMNIKLFYKKKQFRANQKAIASDLYLNNKVSKSFGKWRNQFIQINKERTMIEKEQAFNRKRLLKKFMNKMFIQFSLIALNFNRLRQHNQEKRRRLIKKVLCGFLQNILINHEKHNKLQQALGHLKSNLLIKSLKSWQYLMPELRQKNSLYKLIKSDKSMKMQLRIFNAFKLYYNFQLNKKTVDHLMTRNIQLITQKRFIKQWKGQLDRRIGLVMLSKTFDKHRAQEFMERVVKKIHYENSVISHMKIFRMFKLLEFTFSKGLKKNVDLKYVCMDNWEKIQQNKLKFGKLHFLRKWKSEYQKTQKDYNLAHFTIIQIKNQIIKKYFNVLKSKMHFNKQKRSILFAKAGLLKHKYLTAFKKTVKSRVNCVEQYKNLTQKRRKVTLSTVLESWMNELSEIMVVRNIKHQKVVELKQKIMQQWRNQIKIEKMNRDKIAHGQSVTNFFRLAYNFKLLLQFKEENQQNRIKIEQVQQQHFANLIKNVVTSFRSYVQQNREQIKKVQQIRKRVTQRKQRYHFRLWTKLVETTLMKIRVLKCLGQINKNVEIRTYFNQWFEYAQQSQIIEQIGEKQFQIRLMQQKQDALRLLRQFNERRVIQRDRIRTINDYWIKKTQLKFMTMFRFGVKLIQRRSQNKVTAYNFCREQLMKKALVSFAYQSQKNLQFRVLTVQYQQTLKQLNAPIFFQRLRSFTYKQKESLIKDEFAQKFMQNKLLSQTFKALLLTYLFKKEQRNRQNRGIIFRCENLLSQAFNNLKAHNFSRKLQQQKRMLLSQTIIKLDQSQALQLAFQSFKLYHEIQRDTFIQARGQIVMSQMSRIFNGFKLFTQIKSDLRQIRRQIEQQHKVLRVRAIMHKWMRALGNEAKIKVMWRNKNSLQKSKVYGVFKHQYAIKRFQFLKLNVKAQNYQQIAWDALYNYAQIQKKLRNNQSTLLYRKMQTTLSKSFMGLRYQTLITKNQRVYQDKQIRMLAIKSFNGWKYQSILDKTFRQYTALKHKKDLSQYFCDWFNLYKLQSTQRNILSDVVLKKDRKEKLDFFCLWKKQAYRERFLDLIQVNFTFPHQRYIADRCFTNWRKYAQLNRQKSQLIEETQNMSSSLLARRVLREWFEASQQNMPARILEMRLSNAVNRLLKVKAFYLINVQGFRNEYINENLEEITTKRDTDLRRDYFNEWRRQFAINQLQKVVEIKNQRRTMKQCLIALKDSCIQKASARNQHENVQSFVRTLTVASQVNLVKTFAACGIKQNKETLLKFYFNKLKNGTDCLRNINQLKEKSEQYFRYKTYMKYFYHMLQTFYINHEDRAYDHQGQQVWQEKTKKKVLHALAVNTLKQRKYHNADLYFHSKLVQEAFESLKYNLSYTKQKSQLNTRMMYFLKKKCIHIFKVAFTQWRVKFENRQYGKQAVCEYNTFRDTKLKRMAFDYFAAIIQQRLQIKDMVSKAQNYFIKKNYLKLAHKCFYALKEHAVIHKHKNEQFQDRELMALKLYAFNLMTSHLHAWRKEVRVNRNRQKRSKMYSMFSAWKFYTKERVLLKKYLQECNMGGVALQGYQSGVSSNITQKKAVDPNLMSTQEMRENVARFSNLQSDFCDGMSQGTPFVTSTERKILGLNPNIINSASPNNYGNRSSSANNRISVGSNINQHPFNSNYNSTNQPSKIQQVSQNRGSSARSINRKYM